MFCPRRNAPFCVAESRKLRAYLPLALTAKTAYDVYNAGRLTIDQWTKHRAFCIWCLVAAAATFASAPPVIPDARVAIRVLQQQTPGARLLRKAA